MAVRLAVTITAALGKGSELAQAYEVRREPEDYQYNRTR